MPELVKKKISDKMRGRTLSQSTKDRISLGVKKAWETAENIPLNATKFNNNNTEENEQ
jgi:hypothetical protein